jgi:hypothetical protein
MSNEKPVENEKDSSTDVKILIMEEGGPVLGVVPASNRAKELFKSWGWDADLTVGILPPDDPLVLVKLVPGHWIFDITVAGGETYILQEIALTSPTDVVH